MIKMLRHSLLIICCLLFTHLALGANEAEPNNTAATANNLPQDTVMNAVMATPGDYDYFKSLPQKEGTLKIYFTFSGGNAGSDFYVYAYNRGQGQIGSGNILNSASGTDSLIIYCRQADSISLLVNASTALNYQIHYTMVETGVGDAEPNNTSAQATFFPSSGIAKGRIGYYANSVDGSDYYKTVLPDDGTLRVYVDKINTSNTTGADFYLYAYNKGLGQIGSMAMINQPLGVNATDTLTIYCRQADTAYFLITASECFSYSLRYEIIPSGTRDVAPNDIAAQATYFRHTDTAMGRIGYYNNSVDGYDYYKTTLPDDGTLRVYVDKINTSNTTGADFYLYAYNKGLGQIGSMSMINQPLGANSTDTLTIYCRQADTAYFLINASDCFSYKLRYEVIPSGTNDAEPNNASTQATFFPQTATAKGRIGYYNNSVDGYDYYKTVLPDDGTLRIYVDKINNSNSTGADFYLYAYNKGLGQIGSMGMINQPLGVNATDTLTIYCRQADTAYFLINASECFSYSLRYEVIPSGTNDAEPNNTAAQATFFPSTATAAGRIGYYANGVDNYDYFKTVLPDEGTLRVYVDKINNANTTGADFYLYAYNKGLGQIGSMGMINQPLGVNATDTLTIYCRQADTAYFLINASECFSYSLRYEVIPSGRADAEPNNTLTTAGFISLSDTLHGRIGHYGNTVDVYDYFRFANAGRSKITAYVTYDNTSNTTGADLYLYLQGKTGNTLISRSYINQPLGIGRDTFTLNCAPADTMLLLLNAGECFSYDVHFKVSSEQPSAKILAARTGSEFGFVAETQQADTLEWDFGNGKKSGFRYPSQTFSPGAYTVRLKATNRTCNINYTDSLRLEVKGIESYRPLNAGAGGDMLMNIYGGGLDTGAVIKLIKGSQVILPFALTGNSKRNMLSANFNLHLVEPGLYNVEITLPGEAPVIYQNGFRIDSFSYPFCKAEVLGPTRWRTNLETNFELKITNAGNVFGNGVVVGFAYPKAVKVSFTPKQIKLDRNATTTVEVDGETFSLSNAVTAKYNDSSSAATPIDSFDGKPYDGYFIYLRIPKVPAGSTVSLPFTAKTTSVGAPAFHVFTHHPNMFGSCETPHWSNVTNMWAAESIDALDMTLDKVKAPGVFKAFTKTLKIGQKHLALDAAYAGAKFDAWWNGYEMTAEMYGNLSAELDEANAFALQTATDEAGSYVFEKGMGKLVANNDVKNKYWNNEMATNRHRSVKQFDKWINEINALEKNTQRLQKFGKAFKTAKDLKTLADKIQTLMKLVEDCPELEPQLADLLKLLEEEMDHKDPNDKKTQSVTSLDPNAIYGPEGVLAPRYRKDAEVMHYMVTCENVDTATAPAQVVRIVDTLDPARFDLSTFEFGNVYIGKKSVRLLSGRDQFFGELSLYPEIPLRARIIAKLDKATGVITWDMIGVDTVTGKLPADPDLGLLPPNITAQIGEAGVSYSVKLKRGLPSGTEINNRASIFFDDNAPIATNTWSNTLDIVKPESRAVRAVLEQDTIIRLTLDGTDSESGIAKYRVFVQADTGLWQQLDIAPADTLSFVGERGSTYRFYTTAIDHVGNDEQKAPEPEAEVTVPLIDDVPSGGGAAYSIYPNPTKGELFIRAAKDRDNCSMTLTDVTGRRAFERSLNFKAGAAQRFDLSVLSNGLYLMVLRGGDGSKETYKILIAHPE